MPLLVLPYQLLSTLNILSLQKVGYGHVNQYVICLLTLYSLQTTFESVLKPFPKIVTLTLLYHVCRPGSVLL